MVIDDERPRLLLVVDVAVPVVTVLADIDTDPLPPSDAPDDDGILPFDDPDGDDGAGANAAAVAVPSIAPLALVDGGVAALLNGNRLSI